MPKWALSTIPYSTSFLHNGKLGPRWNLPITQALLIKKDTSKDPSTYNAAKNSIKCEATRAIEYETLIKNQTWKLIPLPNGKNIVGYKYKPNMVVMDKLTNLRQSLLQKVSLRKKVLTTMKLLLKFLYMISSIATSHR